MTPAMERLERLAAGITDPMLASMSQTALMALLTFGALFLVTTEVLRYCLIVSQRQTGFTMAKFWSVFLIFPLFFLLIRLLSLDTWAGALGNPWPMVANMAIVGFDTDATGQRSLETLALEDTLRFTATSRAGQILWPSLLAIAGAWWLAKSALQTLHTTPQKAWGSLAAAGLLALFFVPVVTTPVLWSAVAGAPEAYLESLPTPTIRTLRLDTP